MKKSEFYRLIDVDIMRYRREFLTSTEIQFLEKLRAVMNKKSDPEYHKLAEYRGS